MATEPVAFTERLVREIPAPPPGSKVRYRDARLPGLALRVKGRAKTWVYYGKSAGRPLEIRLGAWPAVPVDTARALARKVAADPQVAATAKREARTVHRLADAWAALEANPTRRRDGAPLRPATWASYQSAWNLLRPALGSRPLAEISGEAVASLRGALIKRVGAAQTARALALLTVLLGGRAPRDAAGRIVRKPAVEPRTRFLDAAELGALLRGLQGEPRLWQVFWLCALLAPLRRGNLQRARWEDLILDFPARWTVGAESAKGRKLLSMPLAEPLARVLREWRQENRSAWIFPAGLTAGPRAGAGPIVSVAHAWRRALLLAEAVRLCDAIASVEGSDPRARFRSFLAEVDVVREESWRTARNRIPMARDGTPLARAVDILREHAKGLGIDPAPLAIRDATPHDLRRTAASWAVQGGASMAVVAASLGHADTRVTEAHYGHLSDDPVRRMLEQNAGRLLGAAGVAVTP